MEGEFYGEDSGGFAGRKEGSMYGFVSPFDDERNPFADLPARSTPSYSTNEPDSKVEEDKDEVLAAEEEGDDKTRRTFSHASTSSRQGALVEGDLENEQQSVRTGPPSAIRKVEEELQTISLEDEGPLRGGGRSIDATEPSVSTSSPTSRPAAFHRTASVLAQPPTPPTEHTEAKRRDDARSSIQPLAPEELSPTTLSIHSAITPSSVQDPWYDNPLSPNGLVSGGLPDLPAPYGDLKPSAARYDKAVPALPLEAQDPKEHTEDDAQTLHAPSPSQWMYITVTDPRKVNDALRSYVVYNVRTDTNLPGYKTQNLAVHRRYNDFVWLYNALVASNPGVVVPVVPEKQALNRFADDFIAHRLTQLQRFIQKVSRHSILRHDPDLRLFLESDKFNFDIKYRKDEVVVPPARSGFLSLGRGNGGRLMEQDNLLESRKEQLAQLETSMRTFYQAVDILSKQKRALSQSIEALAQPFASLADSGELSAPIQNVLRHLSKLQVELAAVQDVHTKGQVDGLASVVGEYARLIDSVKLAYAGRVSTWIKYTKLESELTKARQAYARSHREQRSMPETVTRMLNELSLLEKQTMDAKNDFENVNRILHHELDSFDDQRVSDVRKTLEVLLDGMCEGQRAILDKWDDYVAVLERSIGVSLAGDRRPQPQSSGQPAQPDGTSTANGAALDTSAAN